MNVPGKAQMDLIERAARAVFPDFESLDVRGDGVGVEKMQTITVTRNGAAVLRQVK